MTDELRAQFREEITNRFNQFKETFKAGREQYLLAINNLMDSIHVSEDEIKKLVIDNKIREKMTIKMGTIIQYCHI